jgi:hypothetical protein
MTNSAASKGNLLGGAFAKALQGYGQEQASQEYGNAYNRALTGYNTNKDTAQQYFGNQTTTYNGNLAAFGPTRKRRARTRRTASRRRRLVTTAI